MLADSSLLSIMVKCWIAEFKMDWTSTTDESCSGCLTEVTMPETIEKLHKVSDHRVKMSEIAETISLSTVHVHSILHEQTRVLGKCCIYSHLTKKNVERMFQLIVWYSISIIQPNFASIHNCWWDLSLQKHSWNQTTIKTTDCER